MNQQPCFARLTEWEKSKVELGPWYVSMPRLCRNPARKDESLCEQCSLRVSKGDLNTQTRMIHGLLTEPPPPSSYVYGSTKFWEMVVKGGCGPCEEWLEAAERVQAEAEEFCSAAGRLPWKVQRPADILEEMVKSSGAKTKVVAAAAPAQTAPPTKRGTLLEKFAPIRKIYEESDKPPEKLETDTCAIKKEVYGDIEVWVSAEGHMFDCDTTGEPGEFLGMIVDGELVESK